jgi:hypothetical protein
MCCTRYDLASGRDPDRIDCELYVLVKGAVLQIITQAKANRLLSEHTCCESKCVWAFETCTVANCQLGLVTAM